MSAIIIESAPEEFIIKTLGTVKDWPWSKPRDHWYIVRDWSKARHNGLTTYAPPRIFHSLAECEQYLADKKTYPRVVKEIP